MILCIINSEGQKLAIMDWHRRLGHLNTESINEMSQRRIFSMNSQRPEEMFDDCVVSPMAAMSENCKEGRSQSDSSCIIKGG